MKSPIDKPVSQVVIIIYLLRLKTQSLLQIQYMHKLKSPVSFQQMPDWSTPIALEKVCYFCILSRLSPHSPSYL